MATIDTVNRVIRHDNFDFKYSPDDFVNAGSADFSGNRLLNRAWVIHNQSYILAIVFADYYGYCEQDALDEAADSGKLDGMLCDDSDLLDMRVDNFDEENPEYHGVMYLGNYGRPYASESIDMFCIRANGFKSDEAIRKMLYEASIVRTVVHPTYDVE